MLMLLERWIRDRKAGRKGATQGQFPPSTAGDSGSCMYPACVPSHYSLIQVFLVDDATSMKSHGPEVKRILSILACFSKKPTQVVSSFISPAKAQIEEQRSDEARPRLRSKHATWAHRYSHTILGSILDKYTSEFDKKLAHEKSQTCPLVEHLCPHGRKLAVTGRNRILT